MAYTSQSKTLFACSAETVWQVLSSEDSYAGWYGWPFPSALQSVEPGFFAGAKLTFQNADSSTIITAIETGSLLILSSGRHTAELRIEPQGPDSCAVFLRYTSADDTGDDDPAGTMLQRLKEVCYGSILPYLSMTAPPPAYSSVRSLFRGYPSLRAGRRNDRSAHYGVYTDNTESDLTVHPRSGIIALLLSIFLFSVLVFTFSFERSDVVPSSGLSVMESDNVNRVLAEQIFAGQGKNELELMLNCRGLRLTTNDYFYCSTARNAAGEAEEQIFVSYDAYGRVRSYAYVAAGLQNERLDLEFWDIKMELNSDMSFSAVELVVGKPLTALRVDRGGRKTLCFGMLTPCEDIFSEELRGELVITLDPAARTVDVDYYPPYDRRPPLPDSETDLLRRQYHNFQHYLEDRDAYEHIRLLLGRRQHEFDVVLGAGDYVKEEDGTTLGSYVVSSPLSDGGPRYDYLVRFDENGTAHEIIYTNRYLCALTGTLASPGEYELSRGMSLSDVYRSMQALPVAARFSDDGIVLCFGDWLPDEPLETCATITVEADSMTRMVTALHYNGERPEEDPDDAQQ